MQKDCVIKSAVALWHEVNMTTIPPILLQWNLSLQTSELRTPPFNIRMPIDNPKQSAIETCTYLTSELRTPLYSVLRTFHLVPNVWIMNSIILWSRLRSQVRPLVLALQFHMDYHEDG